MYNRAQHESELYRNKDDGARRVRASEKYNCAQHDNDLYCHKYDANREKNYLEGTQQILSGSMHYRSVLIKDVALKMGTSKTKGDSVLELPKHITPNSYKNSLKARGGALAVLQPPHSSVFLRFLTHENPFNARTIHLGGCCILGNGRKKNRCKMGYKTVVDEENEKRKGKEWSCCSGHRGKFFEQNCYVNDCRKAK